MVLEGLESSSDTKVWNHAKNHGFVIDTRDADFEELSLVWGPPPQVIWLKTKNLSRAATLKILLDNKEQIEESLVTYHMACVDVS